MKHVGNIVLQVVWAAVAVIIFTILAVAFFPFPIDKPALFLVFLSVSSAIGFFVSFVIDNRLGDGKFYGVIIWLLAVLAFVGNLLV